MERRFLCFDPKNKEYQQLVDKLNFLRFQSSYVIQCDQYDSNGKDYTNFDCKVNPYKIYYYKYSSSLALHKK